MKISLLALFIACMAKNAFAAQVDESKSSPQEQHERAAFADMPWPVKLGARSQGVSQAFPLIDRVVLVPDAATYVDELSKWSPQGRWPVLIEDRYLAPMFVRRFKPAQLIRRESVGEIPADPNHRKQQLEQIIVRSFGGNPQQQSVKDMFASQNYVPPGVVLTTLSDPAWTAAIALAAGRGQPIAWMDDSHTYGGPNDELNDETAKRLMNEVDSLVEQQGYSFRGLGDDIDAITICRAIAAKARVNLPTTARNNPGGPHGEGPVAVTDVLGRNADGTRHAIVGWIFGDEMRAAYMAMCSLFLQRDRAMFFNTYPSDATWKAFGLNDAAELLKRSGFSVQSYSGDVPASVDERAWLRLLVGGLSTDLAVINTKGDNNFFDLHSGHAYPDDVPVLNEPIALHFIHSWSMQYPDRADTVGGQWLRHGAYAAVGSCWEPYLMAFVPPSEVANRWMNYVPFLVGARWWDGQSPLSIPWRVVTIGDPLMLCAPVAKEQKPRVAATADYGVDLMEHVKTLLRQAENDESGEMFAHAIAVLNMLGKDDIAAGAWRLANAKGAGEPSARAALDVLFRRRDTDEFMRAWEQLPRRDEQAIDMLWHLLTPRLGLGNTAIDQAVLLQLQSAIRHPLPQHDLKRLSSALQRAFGNAHVRSLIEREAGKAVKSEVQAALNDLVKVLK